MKRSHCEVFNFLFIFFSFYYGKKFFDDKKDLYYIYIDYIERKSNDKEEKL